MADYLKLVRLEGFENRRIHELSGGQQQRVAIARALVFEPDLLLLDEPLAALDRKLREEMQLEFRRIQKELGVTTINVTHDQREALVVSDQIIVMNDGEIQQNAAPTHMYKTPSNPFVANFIGVTNDLSGTLARLTETAAVARIGDVELSGIPGGAGSLEDGTAVKGAIRAEQIRIAPAGRSLAGLDADFQGVVLDAIFEGERLLYEVRIPELGDETLKIIHHDQDDLGMLEPGVSVNIGWKNRDLQIFPASQ